MRPGIFKSTPASALIPLLFAVSLFLFAGCAGYRLGPTNGEKAGARSIKVVPFLNETLEPRLSEPVAFALRRRLQQDGTYRLETSDDADLTVTGTIIRFERSELAFQPRDVQTVRDYYLTLYAQIVVVDRLNGKTTLNRQVHGRTAIRVGSDLASAERQAVPLLAADLAKNVTSIIVDGTW